MPSMTGLLVIVGLMAASFVAGILVGRRNRSRVDAAVNLFKK